MPEVQPPPLSQLTSLRFFAATDVVLFHLSYGWNEWPAPSSFVQGLTCGGYAAVSFFFVLSGFILSQAPPPPTTRQFACAFWLRRFARIFPVYLLGLAVAFPFVLVALFRDGVTWFHVLGLGSVLVLLQAWWPTFALFWNAPSWSLSVESFFYLLFPWLRRRAGRISLPAFLAITYALLLITTAMRRDALSLTNLADYSPAIAFQYYFPLMHLPQFIFGMALAKCRRDIAVRFPDYVGSVLFWLSIASIVLIFGFMYRLPWWTRGEAILAPLFGIMIVSAAGSRSSLKLLRWPFLVLLGEASYSLYILHIPLLKWWEKIFQTGDLSAPAHFGMNGLYFLVATALSIVTYIYVEKPLRYWIIRRGGFTERA